MRALMGLGNPGEEYRWTRHNVGRLFVEWVARREGLALSPGPGDYWEARWGDLILVIPSVFMNLSGVVARQLVERGLAPGDIMVAVDDVALPPGRVRLRGRGGSGGHRGLESVIYHLGTEEFPRIRFGVGRDPGVPLRDWVLSPMSRDEAEAIFGTFELALRGVLLYWEDPQRAMSVVNGGGA